MAKFYRYGNVAFDLQEVVCLQLEYRLSDKQVIIVHFQNGNTICVEPEYRDQLLNDLKEF